MKADAAVAVAKGLVTCVPGAYSLLGAKRTTANALPTNYYYGVWLKHLTLIDEATGCGVPGVIVELGPGDTIGVGISALLSGAIRYIGVDARQYASASSSSKAASQLMQMFRKREPFVPSGAPPFRHLLDERFFPSTLLSDDKLKAALAPDRLGAIHNSILRMWNRDDNAMISYRAPMSAPSAVKENSADCVLPHSVLEHVADLPNAIRSTFRWLRPGGLASHQFDLRSHNIVRAWDGHRAFGDLMWKAVVGGRSFLINRLPFSRVVDCFKDAGFSIIRASRIINDPTLPRSKLCSLWREASEEDLHTEGGYIIAQKPA